MASLPRDEPLQLDEVLPGLADDRHSRGSRKLEGAEDLYRIRVGD